MNERLLRRREVESRTGLSTTTIYRLMRQERFPLPLKIGPKAVRWPESEIADWIAGCSRATGETEAETAARRPDLAAT